MLLGVACGSLGEPRIEPPAPRTEPHPPVAASALVSSHPDGGMPAMLITDRAALAVIAEGGGDLGQLAFGTASRGQDNAALWSNGAYRALMQVIVRDVRALEATDPQAGVAIRGHAHRLFDVRWLQASEARFELVAVVNRMDRHAFNPEACGELRLVYRLAYRQATGQTRLASRLPMTLALELRADPAEQPGACLVSARRWHSAGLSGRALAGLLTRDDGPLSARQLARARIVQIVSNVQTVRWPSAVRPELGGHAEYVLRAFAPDRRSSLYRPRKLENTPDVARLSRDPMLRARLSAWLRDPAQLAAVDGATVRVPDEFLAESVVSVTPRGFARLANRPFRALYAPSTFASLALSGLRHARSPEALLRRLDDLTCSGCHQSRSIAGFHLLGEDAPDSAPESALWTGSSPHMLADLARREAYVRAVMSEHPADLTRPLAERALRDDGGYGAHCGLGDPGFASWTCAAGLHCDAYEAASDEGTVGVCLPAQPGIGDPCEPARVRPALDAHHDGVVRTSARTCGQVCEATRVGFPGGMCAGSCATLPSEAACGGIAILSPFNSCLARGRPFTECARDHVRPAALRACSERAPCRDDYVCTRSRGPSGVCLPPYFVFQLRVDGHPAPR